MNNPDFKEHYENLPDKYKPLSDESFITKAARDQWGIYKKRYQAELYLKYFKINPQDAFFDSSDSLAKINYNLKEKGFPPLGNRAQADALYETICIQEKMNMLRMMERVIFAETYQLGLSYIRTAHKEQNPTDAFTTFSSSDDKAHYCSNKLEALLIGTATPYLATEIRNEIRNTTDLRGLDRFELDNLLHKYGFKKENRQNLDENTACQTLSDLWKKMDEISISKSNASRTSSYNHKPSP